MENQNLNTAIEKFKSNCKKDLELKLVSKGHIDTGKLSKSIEINIVKTEKDFNIEITALKYLAYLDKGKFLKEFIKEQTIKLEKEISKAYAKDIVNQIIK